MINFRHKLPTDKTYDDIIDIMSENNDESKKLLQTVFHKSGVIDKESTKAWGNELGSHLMPGYMNLLNLDDMNIRGKQVSYAYEYCDKDIVTFIKNISNRDSDMVEYVNFKAVSKAVENHSSDFQIPKAVTHGASFNGNTDSILSHNFQDYITNPKQALSVDYKNREIHSGMPIDNAVEILKGNGFEPVYDEVVANCDPVIYGGPARCIIMQNPKSGAVMEAAHAVDDDICYGGCEITMVSKNNGNRWGWGVETNIINDHKDMFVHHMHYSNGLIHNHNKIASSTEIVADTTVLGYSDMRSIPLPQSESYEDISHKHKVFDFKSQELHSFLTDDYGWFFNKYVQCLQMDDMIKNVNPDKQWLYEPFFENRYKETVCYGYLTNNVREGALLIGAAFKMCGISESEIDKYYDAAICRCDRLIDGLREDSKEFLKNNRDLFYGNSKITKDFLKETGLMSAVPIFDNEKSKQEKRQQRIAQAEALCPSDDSSYNDYQFE